MVLDHLIQTFDFASQVKPGNVIRQRGSRLKNEEYRANIGLSVEWDDHMRNEQPYPGDRPNCTTSRPSFEGLEIREG